MSQHFEYSTAYSTYIPCRQTATWLADSRLRGACCTDTTDTYIRGVPRWDGNYGYGRSFRGPGN
eukprot:1181388-Prorocentrum_minimum.AAC.1